MEPFNVVVNDIQMLDTLPSGSGLAYFKNSVYIVGDDATKLFKLDPETKNYSETYITIDSSDTRLAKAIKHDYESLEVIHINKHPYLIAFGSGSLQPYRDSLLMISCKNEKDQKIISLDKLYSFIKHKANVKILNIEGSVISGEMLYLMDRENDNIYTISVSEFISYVESEGKEEIQDLVVNHIELPAIDGLTAGLSGGCAFNKSYILFSASLEDTPNAIDDGTVKGSYVGIISLQHPMKIISTSIIKDKKGNVILDKLESIDIIEKMPGGKLKAFAIADNDDGSSKLFELMITPGKITD